MTNITLSIIISLVVATIAGLAAILRRQIIRVWHNWRAVDVLVEPVIGDEWMVAFAGDIPNANQIEGIQQSGSEIYNWLSMHGGVDFRETRLRLTVRGISNDTVVIRKIRVEAKHYEPFSGTNVNYPTAGANATKLLVFDLDEQEPDAWEWFEDGGRELVGKKPFFELNNVTLARGEVYEFVIVGTTNKYLVQWNLCLDLLVGKHKKTVTINDSGKPFKTSGIPSSGFVTTLDWAWYEGFRFIPSSSSD